MINATSSLLNNQLDLKYQSYKQPILSNYDLFHRQRVAYFQISKQMISVYIFFGLFAMQGDEPFCTIFLFINSASGGGIGNTILSHEAEKIEFSIPLTKNGEPKLIYVYFFDLLTKRARAFKLLKETTQKGRKALGIVCGGDGTIIWVVSQMYNHTIDPSKVALGILPLGTGNDFSQNLGWGKEKTTVTQNHYRHLKKLIRKWLVAKQEYFDIWDVVAEVHERGKFQKINKQSQSQQIQGKIFRRSFCNYFSFGIDGKVGYSFDKRRTNSRIGNLMVYGAMGLLKSATRTKTIKELVDKMEVRHEFGDEVIEIQGKLEPPKEHIKSKSVTKSLQNSKIQTPDQSHSVIFSSIKKPEQVNTPILQSDYYNLLVLNIDSYMGGVKNIWSNAKSKEMTNNNHKFHAQASNDGEVEILAFSSSAGLALQRLIGGFGSKIAQGSGPFYITFKQYKQQKHRTYLQIDGQFIRFTHPKSLIIRKSYLSPTGQIRVLRRNPPAEQE